MKFGNQTKKDLPLLRKKNQRQPYYYGRQCRLLDFSCPYHRRGFTADGLQQLDRYAELFISEKLVYKRFSPLEQYGCAAGGTTHVIATLLAGAEVDADSFAPGISDFKRMCQRGKTQALRIEQWAKAVGV